MSRKRSYFYQPEDPPADAPTHKQISLNTSSWDRSSLDHVWMWSGRKYTEAQVYRYGKDDNFVVAVACGSTDPDHWWSTRWADITCPQCLAVMPTKAPSSIMQELIELRRELAKNQDQQSRARKAKS